jgi:hypothetical protein
MTATALTIIESAMSKIGMLSAGETVSAEDADVGLRRLNALVDALENEGFFAYTTVDTTFTLTAGDTSMTIGPAQEIDIARPMKILRGSFSRLNGTDYPLNPISEPEYNEICQKTSYSSVAPSVCFFDGGSPTGTLYFWPAPTEAVEVHLITPESGGQATDLTTAYVFPNGYQRYIEFALGIEMAPDFNVVPSPQLYAAAANAKRTLKRTNSRIPQLDIDYPNKNSRGDIFIS